MPSVFYKLLNVNEVPCVVFWVLTILVSSEISRWLRYLSAWGDRDVCPLLTAAKFMSCNFFMQIINHLLTIYIVVYLKPPWHATIDKHR